MFIFKPTFPNGNDLSSCKGDNLGVWEGCVELELVAWACLSLVALGKGAELLVEGGGGYPRGPTCGAAAAVASVVSDSVRPHRWQPTRLHHPWDSPGKNTADVGNLISDSSAFSKTNLNIWKFTVHPL